MDNEELVSRTINTYTLLNSPEKHGILQDNVYIKNVYEAYLYQSTIDKYKDDLYNLFINISLLQGNRLETFDPISENKIVYFNKNRVEIDITIKYIPSLIDKLSNQYEAITCVVWN